MPKWEKFQTPLKTSDLQIVRVEWLDAEHDPWDGDLLDTPDNLPELSEVGFLIKKNKTVVVLATSCCLEDNFIRFVIKIPTSLVTRITLLEAKNELFRRSPGKPRSSEKPAQ